MYPILWTPPSCATQLLAKPPFRFLHDIARRRVQSFRYSSRSSVTQVSAVTKKTGFAEDLYEGEELESGSIKDKDAKLSYLKKIVDCVSICFGEELDVRGAKVRLPELNYLLPP